MRTFAAILLLLASAAAQQSTGLPDAPSAPRGATAAEDARQEPLPNFKVDVKLVNVFVTALDPKGAPVANLTKDDFLVLEDGQPEKIAVFERESGLPLSIVLAIDTSLSTKKDLKLEVESARRFAHSILRPIDALALYQFNENVDELVPFTANLPHIDRGIERLRVGSATALYDALYLGAEALEPRRGRKVIVVITDGGDTISKTTYGGAVRAAQQAEAIVYSIVVVPIESSAGRDTGGEHALIQLSRDTGGKHYYATSLAQLHHAFQQISDELRTQYLLGYYPARRVADSEFRRIEVRLRGDDDDSSPYKLRYRTGYYTSKLR